MFGHEPKEWTSQDIGAALLLLLRDTKIVPRDKQQALGKSLAIFIKSTANSHLWTATQLKALADTAQAQVKEALAKIPATPQKPQPRQHRRQVHQIASFPWQTGRKVATKSNHVNQQRF